MQKYLVKKATAILVSLVFLFVVTLQTSNSARAWWGILDTDFDPAAAAEGALQYAQSIMTYAEQYANDLKTWAQKAAVGAIKKAAINAIQKKIQASTKSKLITDYGKYLYADPIKKTSKQMDSFFSAMSGGTSSSLNYEGIGGGGNSYSKYLETQAKKSINGVNMRGNISNVVSDPTKPFSSGNMQGIMSFLECSNNPYCVSIAAQSQYNKMLEQNKTIAEDSQSGGYAPTQDANGNIIAAASKALNLDLSVSQMATNAITSISGDDSSSASSLVSTASSFIGNITDNMTSSESSGSNNSEGFVSSCVFDCGNSVMQ